MTEPTQIPSAPGKLRNSGWGKASCFMLVAAVGLFFIGGPILFVVLMASEPPALHRYSETGFMVIGATLYYLTFILPVPLFVGVVFALKGIFQKDRRKVLV